MRHVVLSLLLFLIALPTLAQPYAIGFVDIDLVNHRSSPTPIPTRVYYPAVSPGQGAPSWRSGERFPVVGPPD